jgi:hypothetical protein
MEVGQNFETRTVLCCTKYLKMEHGEKFKLHRFKGLPMVRGIDFVKILKSSTQRIIGQKTR